MNSVTHDGEDAQMAVDGDDNKEYPCLIRVTDGNETNFSTTVRSMTTDTVFELIPLCTASQVDSRELDKFHAVYGTLLKASMTTLRKRDKKRERQRVDDAARRKRRLAEEIVIQGAKRGNGRHKRQRRLNAAARQEEARKRVQASEEAKGRTKGS